MNTANLGPLVAHGDIKIQTNLRPRTGNAFNADVGLTFQHRIQPTSNEVRQQMHVSLNSLNVQGFSLNTATEDQASIETRVVGSNMYMRINNLSEAAITSLEQTGVDAEPLVGKWLVFPAGAASALGGMVPILPPLQGAAQPLSAIPDVIKIAGTKNAITVKRIEKTWKDNAGQDYMRVRIGLNTAAIATAQRVETASVGNKDPMRRAKLTAITKRYTDLKSLLKTMEFVTEVNKTRGTLTRFEFGGSLTQPTKQCTISPTRKQTCKTTGTLGLRYNAGLSLSKDHGSLIASPTGLNLSIATQE